MPDPTSPDLLTSADRPARLTVRNDAGTIELTPRVVAALIEVMRATCAMHVAMNDNPECWQAGRCEIEDWASAVGMSFTYGESPDDLDQADPFVVAAAKDPTP